MARRIAGALNAIPTSSCEPWPMVDEILGDGALVEGNGHRVGRRTGHSLALAVCRQCAEVLLELLRRQIALAVTTEHRLDAQIGAQQHPAVRASILDDVLAGRVAAQPYVCGLHPNSLAGREDRSKLSAQA